MLFHIDNNLIFSFSPSNISSSSLSLKSLYSLDFCLIAFLNRPELELALPGEPAAMLEFWFWGLLGALCKSISEPYESGRCSQEHQATTSRSQPLGSRLLPVGAVREATRETKQQPTLSYSIPIFQQGILIPLYGTRLFTTVKHWLASLTLETSVNFHASPTETT